MGFVEIYKFLLLYVLTIIYLRMEAFEALIKLPILLEIKTCRLGIIYWNALNSLVLTCLCEGHIKTDIIVKYLDNRK